MIHLISISGLHMVLLCGAVFWGLRLLLALSPHAALHWPTHKIAAFGALLVGAFYYLLSGGAIPAERAWVMIAVVFGAVLAGRRAISLRSLALAAVVVLVLRPESLTDAGFQMSFAATLALVIGVEPGMALVATWPRWLRVGLTALLASLLAGSASAPFAAAHFNRFAAYGLIANLIAAPLMGFIVMPLCVVWMLAIPFGLTAPVLWLMGFGIGGVLATGQAVAAMPGSFTMVPSPPAQVLPLMTIGALILALLQGRGRLLGVPIIALAAVYWTMPSRPDLLVSSRGALAGVMSEAGRALSSPKGEGFAAQRWLEDDGDGADQAAAGARPAMSRSRGRAEFRFAGKSIIVLTGAGAAPSLSDACQTFDLVITSASLRDHKARGGENCIFWDRDVLAQSGAVGIWLTEGSVRIETARSASGDRLWTGPPAEPIPWAAAP